MEPGEIEIDNYLLSHDIDEQAILNREDEEDNNNDFYGEYGKE